MYLDFEDNRPDTPRVPQALTRLERFLLVLVAYLAIIVTYFVVPTSVWEQTPAKFVPQPPDQMIRFVQIEPLRDRIAPPKPVAPPSDLDRRAATIEKAPKPKNDDPVSRGNTPEKFESPPEDRSKGAASPAEPSSASTTPDGLTKVAPAGPLTETRPNTGVGNGLLRNLQHYLPQTYDNPQGGQTESGADIQFDSKGVDFGSWLRRFRAQVYRNWIPYIPSAADFQQGDVVIYLDIHRDGSITNLHIVRGSGHEPLDVVALNALKLSNPTVPLPTAFPDDVAPFTVTFRYILRQPQ